MSPSQAAPRVKISLRVVEFTMPYNAICDALGLAPKITWVRGAERLSSEGRPLGGHSPNYRHHALVFELASAASGSVTAALEALVERLDPQRRLFAALEQESALCELFVGHFIRNTADETFAPALMRRLRSLNLDVHLDVYGQDPADLSPWGLTHERIHDLRTLSMLQPDSWMGIAPDGAVVVSDPDNHAEFIEYVAPPPQSAGNDNSSD